MKDLSNMYEFERGKLTINRSGKGLELFFLTLIMTYDTLTFINAKYNFYLSAAFAVLFIAITYIQGYAWNFRHSRNIWFVLTFLTFFIMFANGAGEKWATYVSGIMHIFFWSNCFDFLMLNFRRKEIRTFLVVNLIILLISIIATLRVLELYPLAARALYGKAEGISDSSFLFDLGCGGFGFVYGLVYLSMGLLACMKEKIITRHKIIILLYLLLCYYLILYAEFTTGMIITILSVLLVLFYSDKHKVVFLFVACIIAILISSFYGVILESIDAFAKINNISILSDKVGLINNAIASKSVDSLSRAACYSKSIEGFLSSPIFGSGQSGAHSQIMDTFSYIGIFAIPYVVYLTKTIFAYADHIGKKYTHILAVMFYALAILNPFVDMTLVAIVFLLCPVAVFLATQTESEYERVNCI